MSYKTVYVSPEVHQRLKLYIVRNGFKGADELIKYWLDSLDVQEKKEQYSLSLEGERKYDDSTEKK